MTHVFEKRKWNEALLRSKARTERAFKMYGNRQFWREYDLQGYMYKSLYKERELRPYLRKEHRIWNKYTGKQLMVLDLALLDPERRKKGYPQWPVREMIQLKYPVKFKTGRTEPDDLIPRMIASSPNYYSKRCRTRIRSKLLVDCKKLNDSIGKALNVSPSAKGHMMYFDLAEESSYPSIRHLSDDMKQNENVDLSRVGPWELMISYVHAKPR